jgi:hypothetical protein
LYSFAKWGRVNLLLLLNNLNELKRKDINLNRRFTLVVSSCPWKIDAQVTAGVQITLAREKFIFLKIIMMKNQKPFLFLNIKQKKQTLLY